MNQVVPLFPSFCSFTILLPYSFLSLILCHFLIFAIILLLIEDSSGNSVVIFCRFSVEISSAISKPRKNRSFSNLRLSVHESLILKGVNSKDISSILLDQPTFSSPHSPKNDRKK